MKSEMPVLQNRLLMKLHPVMLAPALQYLVSICPLLAFYWHSWCFFQYNGNFSFNEKVFEKNLSTYNIPDPELIIRTSGEERISNFYLWQAAYSELYFTDILWPDFNKNELNNAIFEFKNRNRRFGKL